MFDKKNAEYKIHRNNIFFIYLGGCTNPPKLLEGTECIYESKDGRAAARYTALAKRDIDTFEHCPVSVCRGNNNWGTFDISFSCK